jgi:hypothetical protein
MATRIAGSNMETFGFHTVRRRGPSARDARVWGLSFLVAHISNMSSDNEHRKGVRVRHEEQTDIILNFQEKEGRV